jgi:hypothetical protein
MKAAIRRVLPQHSDAVLAAATDALRAHPGVRGWGIDQRRLNGEPMGYDTLVVWVAPGVHPDALPEVRVRRDGTGRRVLPEVRPAGFNVQTATYRGEPSEAPPRQAPFTGLHIGSCVAVGGTHGAVGAWLGTDSRPTHLVTAGHLFRPGDTDVIAAEQGGTPVRIGRLERNLLDSPTPIDVAVVRLVGPGAQMALRGTRRVAPPVGIVDPSDVRGDVQAWQPSIGGWSEPQRLLRVRAHVRMCPHDPRAYTLIDPVQTGSFTRAGDSGTCLLTRAPRHAVGLFVGTMGSRSLFVPMTRLVRVLGIGLWRR